MANTPFITPQEAEQLSKLYTEIERTQERINAQNEKMATARLKEQRSLQERIKQEDTNLKTLKEQVKSIEDKVTAGKEVEARQKKVNEAAEYERDIIASIANLNPKVLKQIQGKVTNTNLLAEAAGVVIDMKKSEIDLSDEELQKAQAKRQQFEGYMKSAMDAARDAAVAAGQMNEHEVKRLKFEESIAHFNEEQKQKLRDLNHLTEQLTEKTHRLHEIQHQFSHLMHGLPPGLSSAITGAQGLLKTMKSVGAAFAPIVLGIAILGAGLHAFTELDAAAEKFRKETGIAASNSKEITNQVHHIEVNFRKVGVTTEMAFDSVKALTEEFGSAVKFSEETVATLSLLNSNLGISASTGAQVQSVFESVGGVSAETAASLQMQVAELSKQAGVAPKKVMEDIAKSAGITSKFFKGDIALLKAQAIQAARLGSSLESMSKTAESLLDFESGIENELVAATMVGGKFNLSRARALAYEGKIVEANEAALDAIQATGDFRDQDMFTQQALAKAAGMEVSEINKMLSQREKLNSLSTEDKKRAEEAIKAGLDITDINEDQLKQKVDEFSKQQEINGQMTQMTNTLMGIVATVGGALTPLFEALGPILQVAFMPIELAAKLFKEIVSNMYILVPLAAALALHYGRAALAAMRERAAAMGTAIANIFSGQAKIPFVGVALAAAGVAAMMSLMSKAGDVNSPAKGKTMVSTKEGGLFELSKNDDLVAGPGVSNAVNAAASKKSVGVGVLSQTANESNNGISAMINELKDMKTQLIRGGIKANAYLDGAKVTNGVASNVNNSTYNNYGLA